MLGPALLDIGEEPLGRRVGVRHPPVGVGFHNGLSIERWERGHPDEFLLHSQGFQDVRTLGSQPFGQAELLDGPLLLLMAVDAHDAEGPSLGAHRGSQDGLERLLAWRVYQREVWAERGVGQRGRLVFGDDQFDEGTRRGQ